MSVLWGVVLIMAERSSAQAWLPEPGEFHVGVVYEFYTQGDALFNSDARDGEFSRGSQYHGNRIDLGDVYSHTTLLYTEYGLARRLALDLGAAWVRARYSGHSRLNPDIDHGDYHGGLQDWRAALRFVLLSGSWQVTPYVATVVPTGYENHGQSALGLGLHEGQLGAFLGSQPFFGWDRIYVHGRFVHRWIEEEEGLHLRLVDASAELGFFLGKHLTISGALERQWATGGREWITDDGGGVHDDTGDDLSSATANERYLRSSVAIDFVITHGLRAFAAWSTTLWGSNSQAANFASLGMAVSFRAPWTPEPMWTD